MKYKSDIVFISIGSNLRSLPFINNVELINFAKKKLPKIGLRVISSSKNWLSYPIPFMNIPYFINCVVKCCIINNKAHNPYVVLDKIKKLEIEIGRKRNKHNFSRIIDIDIIDFKGKIINDELILPHPRLHLRKFVLNPMKTIAQNWKHPVYKKKIDFLITKIRSQQKLIEKL